MDYNDVHRHTHRHAHTLYDLTLGVCLGSAKLREKIILSKNVNNSITWKPFLINLGAKTPLYFLSFLNQIQKMEIIPTWTFFVNNWPTSPFHFLKPLRPRSLLQNSFFKKLKSIKTHKNILEENYMEFWSLKRVCRQETQNLSKSNKNNTQNLLSLILKINPSFFQIAIKAKHIRKA